MTEPENYDPQIPDETITHAGGDHLGDESACAVCAGGPDHDPHPDNVEAAAGGDNDESPRVEFKADSLLTAIGNHTIFVPCNAAAPVVVNGGGYAGCKFDRGHAGMHAFTVQWS